MEKTCNQFIRATNRLRFDHCSEPRGFGFVKFRNPEDAAEAKHQLNHCVIGGREIAIVYAEENRKTPREMRTTSQPR